MKFFSYIAVIIVITCFVVFFMYIDSRLFDKPKKKSTYIKNILLVNFVILVLFKLLEWLNISKNNVDILDNLSPFNNIKNVKNTTILKDIGEEIFTDKPDF